MVHSKHFRAQSPQHFFIFARAAPPPPKVFFFLGRSRKVLRTALQARYRLPSCWCKVVHWARSPPVVMMMFTSERTSPHQDSTGQPPAAHRRRHSRLHHRRHGKHSPTARQPHSNGLCSPPKEGPGPVSALRHVDAGPSTKGHSKTSQTCQFYHSSIVAIIDDDDVNPRETPPHIRTARASPQRVRLHVKRFRRLRPKPTTPLLQPPSQAADQRRKSASRSAPTCPSPR